MIQQTAPEKNCVCTIFKARVNCLCAMTDKTVKIITVFQFIFKQTECPDY